MAHTDKNRKSRNWQKGQSLVEVALALTFLLIMVAGSVDVGRVFLGYISLRDSAQEGVAFGTVFPTYCSQIVARAVTSGPTMFSPTADMVDVTISGADCASANPDQACIGNDVVVTITNDAFPLTMPFIGAAMGKQTITLSARARDTILRPPCP
jgi:hypothetical protein